MPLSASTGRHGIGIETNGRWAEIAALDIERASADHTVPAPGTAYVWQRPNPATLPPVLYEHYQGRIALALTALPHTSGRRPQPSRCTQAQSPASAGYSGCMQDPKALMLTFTEVLRTTRELLKPGGLVAWWPGGLVA